MRVARRHYLGSPSEKRLQLRLGDPHSTPGKSTQFTSLRHELHFASSASSKSCAWHVACAMENGVVCPCWIRSFLLYLMLLEPTLKMSKLWIVHRSPQHRASLARLSGLTDPVVVGGAPNGDEFVAAPDPAAIVLGLEGDFERELEFAHRNHARLAQTRWGLICAPQDAQEAGRLFRMTNPEILTSPPTARTLRAFVAAAVAHRSSASLAERQQRQRIAERFSAWLGGVEVPGLLRAVPPVVRIVLRLSTLR